MKSSPQDFKQAVAVSGLSIYDLIPVDHPTLWIPTAELEILLEQGLKGTSLKGLPLRTRSKVVKELICKSLGYSIPKSFKKTKPRFPGQNFDTYTQKSLNLQVWNEEVSPTRRYAIIGVNESDEIFRVRVVTGSTIAALDKTGTITRKYQARVDSASPGATLVSQNDTPSLAPLTRRGATLERHIEPTSNPNCNYLLPISEVFEKLAPLVGKQLRDPGVDQERNRGAELHKYACEALGYSSYSDNGQFPDIRNQLLEIKLQTSPTIDLGMALPNGDEKLAGVNIQGTDISHKDVRYAVFCGEASNAQVRLDRLYVVTGSEFFNQFRRFEGKVSNGKIQIPLPSDFFD